MDRKIQSSSPKSSQVPSTLPKQPLELGDPPFERWIRMADELLRDWPHPPANSCEHRI
jgi:hypothetical protein